MKHTGSKFAGRGQKLADAPKQPKPRPARAARLVRRKGPRLRVVAHSLSTPRHIQAWRTSVDGEMVNGSILEMWTEAEWNAMHPAERPEGASLLPGFGWAMVTCRPTAGEWHSANEAYREMMARYNALREMD